MCSFQNCIGHGMVSGRSCSASFDTVFSRTTWDLDSNFSTGVCEWGGQQLVIPIAGCLFSVIVPLCF